MFITFRTIMLTKVNIIRTKKSIIFRVYTLYMCKQNLREYKSKQQLKGKHERQVLNGIIRHVQH